MSIQQTALFYGSIRPSNERIYHIQNDHIHCLTEAERFDTHPVATPDGKSIIYSRAWNGSSSLMLRSLADGSEKQLTDSCHFEDFACFDTSKNLYFISDFDGLTHIWKVKFDPKGIKMADAQKITSGPGSNFSFCISPDEKEIVFSSNRENLGEYPGPQPTPSYQSGRLYIMQIDRPETVRPLIANDAFKNNPWWEGTPFFSQDGQFVFYYSTEKNAPQLMKYDIHSKTAVELTGPDEKALYPSLAENNQIIFSSQNREKDVWNAWKIQKMDFFGNGRQTVVQSQMHNYWAPKILSDGSVICYGSDYSSGIASPHGEGKFIADQYENEEGSSYALRGLFPAISKTKIACIEAMRRIVQYDKDGTNSEVLYEGSVFGLSSAADGSLVTASGMPFSRGITSIMLVKQKEAKNLTSHLPAACNVWPAIAPDASMIVFSRQLPNEAKQLYSIDAHGQNLTQLTFDTAKDHTMPSISRCGRKIVCCTTNDKKTYSLLLLELDEAKAHVVSSEELSSGYVDTHPAFLPDGKQIVFSSNRGGHKREVPLHFFFNPQPYGDLFCIESATKKIRQLTHSPFEESTPICVLA